jgi:hypothetical protein
MTKTMTLKGFLAKTRTKAAISAGGFLAQYREFLTTGEIAQFTSPILAKLDNKELLPTPALNEITSVVFAHMMAQESVRAEESLKVKASAPKVDAAYLASIKDGKGNILLEKGFKLPQDAERWIDLRLIENGADVLAEMVSSKVKDRDGNSFRVTITREEAFGRLYRERKMASHKKTGVSMSKLGFGVKAKNDRFHFSHG